MDGMEERDGPYAEGKKLECGKEVSPAEGGTIHLQLHSLHFPSALCFYLILLPAPPPSLLFLHGR